MLTLNSIGSNSRTSIQSNVDFSKIQVRCKCLLLDELQKLRVSPRWPAEQSEGSLFLGQLRSSFPVEPKLKDANAGDGKTLEKVNVERNSERDVRSLLLYICELGYDVSTRKARKLHCQSFHPQTYKIPVLFVGKMQALFLSERKHQNKKKRIELLPALVVQYKVDEACAGVGACESSPSRRAAASGARRWREGSEIAFSDDNAPPHVSDLVPH